jgi:hypothetical protein
LNCCTASPRLSPSIDPNNATMDRRFSGLYARSALYPGQGLGSRRQSTWGDSVSTASGSSLRYPNSRRTLGPSQLTFPYIPSLKRCVASLEASTRMVSNRRTTLPSGTGDDILPMLTRQQTRPLIVVAQVHCGTTRRCHQRVFKAQNNHLSYQST